MGKTFFNRFLILGILGWGVGAWGASSSATDAYRWLELVHGKRATQWVAEQNKTTLQQFENDPLFQAIEKEILDLESSDGRLIEPKISGGYVYYVLQDDQHPQGLWLRQSIQEYEAHTDHWELLLDLDELSQTDGKTWVLQNFVAYSSKGFDHALVSLSDGGEDQHEIREFDLATKTWVTPDQGGFFVPRSNSSGSWVDQNTVSLNSALPGDHTLTMHPGKVRLWKRGQKIKNAEVRAEAEKTDNSIWTWSLGAVFGPKNKHKYMIVTRALDFFHSEKTLVNTGTGKRKRLDLPTDAKVKQMMGTKLLVIPVRPWKVSGQVIQAGELVGVDLADLKQGKSPTITRIYSPQKSEVISDVDLIEGHLYLTMLENDQSRIYRLSQYKEKPGYRKYQVPLPSNGTASIVDDHEGTVYVKYESFLSPEAIFAFKVGKETALRSVRQEQSRFDASAFEVSRRQAVSADGTKIPYWIVKAKDTPLDGSAATLLYGYGGFSIEETPEYNAKMARPWLSRGGIYVLANIRGGGEYGPDWHLSAQLKNKQRSYDDFIAVAEDLIKRKVTSSEHLGIRGGSNGGLLVGATYTQRPDLFNAAVSEVPLLDMLRYDQLLVGRLWMAEYGDPSIEADREVLSAISPYHNVDEAKDYCSILFTTSTKDDRVSPAHARKMTARLQSKGIEAHFYEGIVGGHSGKVNPQYQARTRALVYTYLWRKLGTPAFQ